MSSLITLSIGSSTARVSTFGACVFSFVSAGAERLYASELSATEGDLKIAIRGGIPICWPVFGPPPAGVAAFANLKQHGFVRTMNWNYLGQKEGEDSVEGTFELKSSEETKKVFNFDFILLYTVTITAAGTLLTALSVTSPSGSTVPLEFSSALHTYIALPKGVLPKFVEVSSLAGIKYQDKVAGGYHVEGESRVEVDGPGGEIDRIYYNTNSTLTLSFGEQGGMNLKKMNFDDVVVWNPGFKKAGTMADMKKGDENTFVCLEPVQVGKFVTLESGEEWIGSAEWGWFD